MKAKKPKAASINDRTKEKLTVPPVFARKGAKVGCAACGKKMKKGK
jgi:hypothetical protein